MPLPSSDGSNYSVVKKTASYSKKTRPSLRDIVTRLKCVYVLFNRYFAKVSPEHIDLQGDYFSFEAEQKSAEKLLSIGQLLIVILINEQI